MKLKIRSLLHYEIDLLKGFPPEEWNFDLSKFLLIHFGKFYFYPLVAVIDNKIVGVANGILNEKVGWLGNIIVLPEFRRQGIGYKLTKYLIDFFNSNDCTTQLLIATKDGEKLYRKLGFKISSIYIFYKGGQILVKDTNPSIRKIRPEDLVSIIELDQKISGEKRAHLIENFYSTGWIHIKGSLNKIDGFYLPELGNGLIITENNKSGLELLEFKLKQSDNVVVPLENKTAQDFLIKNGYTEYLRVPRMVLGKEVSWKSKFIFSRAAGYCG